jgi:hypothetical protein
LSGYRRDSGTSGEGHLIGKMVEVHLLNDKRFLGKVRRQDRDGITVYCIPLAIIDNSPQGSNLSGQLGEILHTLFFPYENIEYIDIGGEPVGFDTLFAQAFGGGSLEDLFEYQ